MRAWVLLGLGLLSGCSMVEGLFQSAPAPKARPAAMTAPRPGGLTALQQCQASLDEFGFDFEVVPAFSTRRGCGMADGVKVAMEGVALNRPTQLSCELALAFANFEYEFIQPLALRHLKQTVTKVYHAGTYDCRDVRGNAKGLSEHARGRAIDVIGFDLSDGSVVNIERDWRGPGPKSEFLRALAKQACARFDVVLGPDHDRDHRDHLHFDLSGKKYCG
ncbi:MAG: extensin family protein [Proteobacteria bacterium]|nr:extensin family protein [Pseudomonadota bacterium]